MTKLCKQRLEEFGTAGQASKIKPVLPPAEMAKRYAKGELDPEGGVRPSASPVIPGHAKRGL